MLLAYSRLSSRQHLPKINKGDMLSVICLVSVNIEGSEERRVLRTRDCRSLSIDVHLLFGKPCLLPYFFKEGLVGIFAGVDMAAEP